MILPVYLYGHPVLKTMGEPITKDYPNLKEVVDNMFETMYNAEGIGLAAPQVGLSIRLFIVDTTPMYKENEKDKERAIKKVFINPEIKEISGNLWKYEEGCLSIPDVRGDVLREKVIEITYYDLNFNQHTEIYDGIEARVMLHEFDHINGILFVERINPLKKKLVEGKLNKIAKGQHVPRYKFKLK